MQKQWIGNFNYIGTMVQMILVVFHSIMVWVITTKVSLAQERLQLQTLYFLTITGIIVFWQTQLPMLKIWDVAAMIFMLVLIFKVEPIKI